MNEKVVKSILKGIVNGKPALRAEDYEISFEEFGDIVDGMLMENLIEHARVIRGGNGNKARIVLLKTAVITAKGLDYLSKNSNMVVYFSGLKDAV